jgi:hypothetical protein
MKKLLFNIIVITIFGCELVAQTRGDLVFPTLEDVSTALAKGDITQLSIAEYAGRLYTVYADKSASPVVQVKACREGETNDCKTLPALPIEFTNVDFLDLQTLRNDISSKQALFLTIKADKRFRLFKYMEEEWKELVLSPDMAKVLDMKNIQVSYEDDERIFISFELEKSEGKTLLLYTADLDKDELEWSRFLTTDKIWMGKENAFIFGDHKMVTFYDPEKQKIEVFRIEEIGYDEKWKDISKGLKSAEQLFVMQAPDNFYPLLAYEDASSHDLVLTWYDAPTRKWMPLVSLGGYFDAQPGSYTILDNDKKDSYKDKDICLIGKDIMAEGGGIAWMRYKQEGNNVTAVEKIEKGEIGPFKAISGSSYNFIAYVKDGIIKIKRYKKF